MSTTTIAFFNSKAGVGKTSLVYHLAWMYSDLGYRVVAADLDPQANLSMFFLNEDRLQDIWLEEQPRKTIFGSMLPLLKGLGDISDPHLEFVADQLALLVGDIGLFQLESQLATSWSGCLHPDHSHAEFSLRLISAFSRIMQKAAKASQANIILMDLAPNLGAINRAAMIAADYVIIPLYLNLSSALALNNLGTTLQDWRKQWQEILFEKNQTILELPPGNMQPIGYVVLQPSVRLDRQVLGNNAEIASIPKKYRDYVLNEPNIGNISLENDPNCLARLKIYPSLISMAEEAHKPMFHLKPADGAMGSYTQAVRNVYKDFEKLASALALIFQNDHAA